MEHMSFRGWISVITLVLLGVIVFAARGEIVHAWQLLGSVNVWILALLLPLQLLAYYAAGEMIFSYLRSKDAISKVSRLTQMRMALEMNFVNHVLPSGGVSGISYMSWRLGRYGVSPGRATAAQAVRYAMGLLAAMLLVALAVFAVTVDGNINRWIILISAAIVSIMGFGTIALAYLVNSKQRMEDLSAWLSKKVNHLASRFTRGKKRVVLREAKLLEFFTDIHDEYSSLKRDRRILRRPFWWAVVFTLADSSLFAVTFWALGQDVNFAPVLIAYVLASIAGFIVVTPGGAGAYEAIMVTFLTIAGISSGVAIAGIILARVVILFTTIALGYLFYQHAIFRYGKGKNPIKR